MRSCGVSKVKKSVIALLLLCVLIIIVSPGILGKLAEESLGENLNRAAKESADLIVSSDGFDRGWFSSEGQHRIELGEGGIRSAIAAVTSSEDKQQLPALLIRTRIDHGLIPVSSMGREQGSLAPGLGSAVSTLTLDSGTTAPIEIPGVIYSKLGLSGALDSRYILKAGSMALDDGEVSWQETTVRVSSNADAGDLKYDADIGAMTFGNDQQIVSIDGLTLVGQQTRTSYGFHVGDIDMTLGTVAIEVAGLSTTRLQGLHVKGASSVEGSLAAASVHFEMIDQVVPGFGGTSIVADLSFSGIDAAALGAASTRLSELRTAPDSGQILMASQEELKDLFAAGMGVTVDSLNIDLPMGTVEAKMTITVAQAERTTFEWPSLLRNTSASLDITIPEALVQLATSMNPQAGAVIAMGLLTKEGDVYEMDADLEKGLLTINGAPIPIPLGAFR